MSEPLPFSKPAKRVVNRDCRPLDETPLRTGRCPVCDGPLIVFSRAHVVPRGQGGDDVPENMVWLCGDGTRGCHGVLTHHGRDGQTGRTFDEVAAGLLAYLETQPLTVAYCDSKKWPGWLHDYYRLSEAA